MDYNKISKIKENVLDKIRSGKENDTTNTKGIDTDEIENSKKNALEKIREMQIEENTPKSANTSSYRILKKVKDAEDGNGFFYDNIVEPTNNFVSNAVIGTANTLAKPALKAGGYVNNVLRTLQGKKAYSSDEIQSYVDQMTSMPKALVDRGDTLSAIGEMTGNTLAYMGTANVLGGGALGYGATSGINAWSNTNDIGDIGIETTKGAVYGKINSLTNNAVVKGIEKIFPATNPLVGNTMNVGASLGKNAIAGATGAYTATALTGEAENVYNTLRNREVTKEDWIKPVWSVNTAISTLVGGGLGAISGTQSDIKARAKYEKDANELVNKLKVYGERFNTSIRKGDQQSALDIVQASRDELVKFSMNKYGNRMPDTKVVNEVANKWKAYLENSVGYYNYISNNEYVNVNGQPQLSNSDIDNAVAKYKGNVQNGNNASKNQSANQDVGASIKELNQNLNNLKNVKLDSKIQNSGSNNAQNLQENTQNQSNIEQSSQNNVQNVSNLEKTVQNDTERFSQQVEEWKKNNWNNKKHLTVLQNTPQVYLDMGLNNLPITVTANKLDRIFNSKGNQKATYHNLQDLVKDLPRAISNPLNIVESSTRDGGIVVVTDLSDSNGDIVVVSLAPDGQGRLEVDDVITTKPANVMTSAYGRRNYDYNVDSQGNYYDGWMEDNFKKGRIIYDINEGIIKKRTNGKWLRLPNTVDSNNKASVKRLQLPSDTGSLEVSSTTNAPINNIIQSTDSSVNNQYMQNNGNNTQGLENSSSFSLPKTWEEVETNVKSRITPEMEKDMKRFVQNNFVNYEKVEGETVDDYVDELIKKIYTPNELEYIYDEDLGSEVFDAVYNTVDKFIEEAGYTSKWDGNKNTFEPDMSFLEDSDEIRMEYDRLPRTDFEFAQLDKIRDRVQSLVWDIENTLPRNIRIDYDESGGSADATYITLTNENTDESYEIRIGNHFKRGVSGEADNHIRISDFKTITKLEEALKRAINDGLVDVEDDDIQSGIENTLKNGYNQVGGVENGEIQRERVLGNNNEQTGIYKDSEQEQINKYTKEQYTKFEQSIKQIPSERLTKDEKNIIKEYKNKYNKDIVLFENEADYGGGEVENRILADVYVTFNSNQFKNVDNTSPTTNSDIRYSQSDKSWSKYLKEYWDLMPNSTKTFGLPSAEELQRFDNEQSKKAYEKLHMINENDNELNAMRLKKPPTYKTNLERGSGLIEQKIKDIEIGKTNRDDIFETTSKREIRKTIENQLGKKMLTKRFNTNKAYGIYKPTTDTIRLAQESDIETALHELGHQVDIEQLNNMTKQISNTDIRNELIELCDNAFPNVYKNQRTKIKEGFAEATRNYIIEPQEFAQKYPHTSYLITEQLEKNPSLSSLFATLQEEVHDYINMSPKDRVLSNVSINDENNKPKIDMKKFGQTFAKLFLDDNIALRNAVEKVAKSQGKKLSELSPNENALLLMKLQQGSQDATLMSLSEGYRNKNGEKVTKGLKEVVENFTNEDIQNLIAYMVSEGNLDYINADKQTGIRENDAKAVLKEFKNTKIDKASKEIREINNYALTRLKDAGMLTEEQIKDMKKINEHYVPMNRVIDEDGSIKTGGNNMRVGNALKRRKGSDKTIINPLESTIVNNMRIDKQIEANEALKTLVNSLKKAGIAGEYFDTVPTPKIFNGTATLERFKNVLEEQGVDTTDMDLSAVYNIYSPKLSDDKNMIMSYMEKGKRKYIQFTDKELYKAINNLNSKQMSLFEQVLSKFNGVLRWGATTANIDFAIPNFIADSQMAFLNSDTTYIPIVDSLVGIVDTLAGRGEAEKFLNIIAPDYVEKKKELYYKYKTSGASNDVNRTGLSRGETRNLMEDVYGLNHKALFGKNKSAIQKGKEVFNLTTAPSDLSEEATRFRNFEKEYALYKKQGMSEEEALEKAGYNARRVTQDFSEAGQITRSINRLKPFTSARIGGVTQTVQNMKQNPKRFAKRLAILVAMDVAMRAINRIISKKLGKNKGKELEELQDQKMFDNYTFYIGDNNILTIKKIQGPVRSILNLSEMATDYALGFLDSDGVKKRLRGILDDAKNDILLVSDESDLVGQLATPLVENALNKDFYYGNDLINDSMKYLDNKDKYDENTSETAKILGELLNYPPIYIDNLIEGYLAGVGTQALKVSDSIINRIEGNEVVETPISEKFILSRFFADTNKNSQSVNEIYEQFEKLSNDKEYNRLTPEQEEMYDNVSDAKDYISMINKQKKDVQNSVKMSGEEKREKLNELNALRTDVARYYLGKDLINSKNKKQIILYEFYPSKDTYTYQVRNGVKVNITLTDNDKKEIAQLAKEKYEKEINTLEKRYTYKKLNESEKEEKKENIKSNSITNAKNEIIKNIYKNRYK